MPPGFENDIANAQTIGIQTGGNPLLVAEKGESYTVGVRYMPRFLPGLSFAIDYFDIEVTDLIAPPDAQAILNACYDSPSGIDNNAYCDAINPRTALGKFAAVALVASGIKNYARQVTEGVDFDLTYKTAFRNGHRLSARLLVTRILSSTIFWTRRIRASPIACRVGFG